MIAKVNELLCINAEWHRNERLAAMCFGAVSMITFVTLVLVFCWSSKNQVILNQPLRVLLVIDIAFSVLDIFFLKRARKLCSKFCDKVDELAKDIQKIQCEQSCERWLANWSDTND